MTWSPSQLYFGADYNPEQWPRETWARDVEQMNELGVNLVTLGVFSWASIEVADGDYRFEWLDDAIDLLHQGGIRVDLATATASPPAWLTQAHPSVCAVNRDGVRLSHGGRQHYSPSSQVYRDKSLALVEKLAERYASHPALEMWHVNNELGCHTPHCYGEESGERFREWLRERYGSVDALNEAWQTRFWSQTYHSFEEVQPPRTTSLGTSPNPGQLHDFVRFSSDTLLDLFIGERDMIRRFDSAHPITTNFMSMRHISALDYWKWAKEVDFVSTDHYAEAHNPRAYVELAFQADLTRGFAQGRPWLLMEHSPAAVNWQPRNVPKSSRETIRHAFSHIARGSNGAMFFQFKQSRGGSERFHSAMVPHAGEETRVYAAMKELGERIADQQALSGSATETARVAMVLDYQSWWAMQQNNLPSSDLDYAEMIHRWYEELFDRGIAADFLDPDAPLDQWQRYETVLLPLLHVVPSGRSEVIAEYVRGGGTIVCSFFSGVADENLNVHLGGYGGALVREVCGVLVEEFAPLRESDSVSLSNGWSATMWTERARPTTAEPLATYVSGEIVAESVAVARNHYGSGQAWYVGTQLDTHSLSALFGEILDMPGLTSGGDGTLEVVRRGNADIVINHGDIDRDLGGVRVAAGDTVVAIVQDA